MLSPTPLLTHRGTMTVIELGRGALVALLEALDGAGTARIAVEVEPGARVVGRDVLHAALKVSADRDTWTTSLAAVDVRTSHLYDA